MSDVSRQVIRRVVRVGGRLIPLWVAGLAASGCASSDRRVGVPSGLAFFPEKDRLPRVVVYGGLADVLPRYDATPALERFLYGPNDAGKTALCNPQGMAMLADRLLVCDQGQAAVLAIRLTDGQSRPWTDARHPPRCPVDVTVCEEGRVYVADTELRAVLVYDAGGRFVEKLAPTGSPTPRFRPCAVLAHGGVLYVGNSAERRVDRWRIADRRWLAPLLAPEGEPALIAPTGLARTADGVLLIADAVQGTVHRVAADGRWLRPLGTRGGGVGEFLRPKQVCCAASGLTLVADAGRRSVLVFDRNGQYIAEVRGQPDGWPGWTLPMGLVAVQTRHVPGLARLAESGTDRRPDECVIVSDSLGAPSLTILGINLRRSETASRRGSLLRDEPRVDPVGMVGVVPVAGVGNEESDPLAARRDGQIEVPVIDR